MFLAVDIGNTQTTLGLLGMAHRKTTRLYASGAWQQIGEIPPTNCTRDYSVILPC
jgi:pantothenate kinase type III